MTVASTEPDVVSALVLLDEPRRRRLYDHVIASEAPVGRDAAAAAVGISRALAAFHLDRLADGGLLEVEYRRLNGRTGPGAGRPAKLYRRAARELVASYPPREYERAAGVLAEAIEREGARGQAVVEDAARARGRHDGDATRSGPVPSAGHSTRRQRRTQLLDQLRQLSFEPQFDANEGVVRLRNCPYHALVATHRELTCGMNLAWAEGLLEGLGDVGLVPELAPAEGRCCVVFRPAEVLAE